MKKLFSCQAIGYTDFAFKPVIVLEERMNTLQSDLQGTLERFRADTADWKTDMAKRETRMLPAGIGVMGLGIAILAFILPSICYDLETCLNSR